MQADNNFDPCLGLGEADLIHELPMVDMHLAKTRHIVNELTRPVCVAQQHHSGVQLCNTNPDLSYFIHDCVLEQLWPFLNSGQEGKSTSASLTCPALIPS